MMRAACTCDSFFNAPATAEIYTLSLHDALPILWAWRFQYDHDSQSALHPPVAPRYASWPRSEEHTSELQSRRDLVCRLLLEKKNPYTSRASATKLRLCLCNSEHDCADYQLTPAT